MGTNKGFSLVELLVVVSIILIIAAMAIPNLIRSRLAANQASAVASLRGISTAEIQYQSNYTQVGFSNSLLELGTGAATSPPTPCPGFPSMASACLIDGVLTGAGTFPKNGYLVAETGVPVGGLNSAYVAQAGPVTFNRTGTLTYCIVADNIVRVNLTNNASGLPGVSPVTCLQAPFGPMT